MSLIPDKIFGLKVERRISPLIGSYSLAIKSAFKPETIKISGTRCILLKTEDAVNLKYALKVIAEIQTKEAAPVILSAPALTVYQRERLSEKNIAFITSGGNLFMPFLGTVITKSKPLVEKPLSPFAQMLFIGILSGDFLNQSFSQLAKKTHKSVSYVSQSVQEIEAISPSFIEHNGKERWLTHSRFSSSEKFERFLPYLSIPIKRNYPVILEATKNEMLAYGAKLSSFTALSKYTKLNPDSATHYAVYDFETIRAELDKKGQCDWSPPDKSLVNAQIEVWRYDPRLIKPFGFSQTNGKQIDPDCVDEISLYLSLRSESTSDDRLAKELEELLERALNAGNR